MNFPHTVFIKRLLQLFLLISLSLFSLVFTTNTYAASNKIASQVTNSSVKPHRVYCDAGWVYSGLTRYNNSMMAVGPTHSDYNGTGSNATATFSASVTGTVSLTASYGIKVSESAVVTSVEENFGLSVTASITATVGNSIAVTVPSHKTVYAQYGVWDVVTSGSYYYMNDACQHQVDDGTITTYAPSYVGWNVWTA